MEAVGKLFNRSLIKSIPLPSSYFQKKLDLLNSLYTYMTATIICRCWLYYFHIINAYDKRLSSTKNYATSASTIKTLKHANIHTPCNTGAQTNIITPFNILYATTFNMCNYKNILLKRKNRIFCIRSSCMRFFTARACNSMLRATSVYTHITCKKRIILCEWARAMRYHVRCAHE